MSVIVLLASLLAATPPAAPPPDDGKPAAIIGTWRGTSTCTDRVAAPACKDEVVVYDFIARETPGVVRWKADKVVNGERLNMGEFDVEYDADDKCWAGEFHGPRSDTRWCLTIDGKHMTGTGVMLPGKQKVRAIDVKKD
jgi:hypothetical protein